MSISIEMGGERVEVADEKEAKKELARLARKQRGDKKEMARRYEVAQVRAERHGFDLYFRVMAGYAKSAMGDMYSPHSNDAKGVCRAGEYSWQTVLYTPDGEAILEHYGHQLRGVVTRAGGVWLVVMAHDDCPSVEKVYAVGVCEGALRLAELPGISADYFRE